MSKKTIQKPRMWEILSAPDKRVAATHIVIGDDNKVYCMRSPDVLKDHPELVVQSSWLNMEDYLTKTNKQTKLAYHEQYVVKNPLLHKKHQDDRPLDKSLDIQEIGWMTWAWFCMNGKPLHQIVKETVLPDGTVKIAREAKLNNRKYVLCDPQPAVPPKTPQAKACLAIMRESAVNSEISEADFKRAIETRAAELHTRQDPWRIFQYYRAGMINDKYFRLV